MMYINDKAHDQRLNKNVLDSPEIPVAQWYVNDADEIADCEPVSLVYPRTPNARTALSEDERLRKYI